MEETALPLEFGEAAFLLKLQWTHEEYEAAPDALVRRMIMLMNAEAEVSKAQMQDAESKMKSRR